MSFPAPVGNIRTLSVWKLTHCDSGHEPISIQATMPTALFCDLADAAHAGSLTSKLALRFGPFRSISRARGARESPARCQQELESAEIEGCWQADMPQRNDCIKKVHVASATGTHPDVVRTIATFVSHSTICAVLALPVNGTHCQPRAPITNTICDSASSRRTDTSSVAARFRPFGKRYGCRALREGTDGDNLPPTANQTLL